MPTRPVALHDATGRVVRRLTCEAGQTYPLDLTNLAPGVFLLRAQGDQAAAFTQRVVKE